MGTEYTYCNAHYILQELSKCLDCLSDFIEEPPVLSPLVYYYTYIVLGYRLTIA